ncbi:hypothetical protein [Sphingomonas sp. Root710]|uniref:hypothetical protein n=1 Tax=Sphingomonas sp. Root710 TaxID=1736594 RepID=UPI000ACECDC5|nr:hypothetical protein [Sphingomonas sp. Root710]
MFIMPEPDADELIVEMCAAPINPTDMFLMGALADPATAERAARPFRRAKLVGARGGR